MVEPFHYIGIVVKGEPKSKYAGVHLDWLAEKFREYGCTEALNLDGGGTACMVFNGKVLVQGDKTVRPLGSMIAFGAK
jgi:exopolysaccharide biosynthesis protein